MGALHEGHLSLTRTAAALSEFVVCSIFVNPTQFGPNEDFTKYPRDLAGDARKLRDVDVVFAPDVNAMYPPGDETRVRVSGLARHLCGPSRPGHFEGVATVVTKLFGIVGPCVAVFGQKDYQQLAVLRRVVTDLFLPVEIVGHPIVREPDGLAMSSRNAYLSHDDRARALALSRGLGAATALFRAGERSVATLRKAALAPISTSADAVDYVSVVDPETLAPLDDEAFVDARALVAVACRIGTTRLIDNVVLGEGGT